jgi:copper oxidase (laccase) domain-containing protein
VAATLQKIPLNPPFTKGEILPPFEKGGQGGFHNFQAFIGPCISQNVYEIGPEVAAQIPAQFLKPGQNDRSHFDLRGLIRWQLEQLGVKDIQVSKNCTYLEPENYHSARRGDTGRQYSWIKR